MSKMFFLPNFQKRNNLLLLSVLLSLGVFFAFHQAKAFDTGTTTVLGDGTYNDGLIQYSAAANEYITSVTYYGNVAQISSGNRPQGYFTMQAWGDGGECYQGTSIMFEAPIISGSFPTYTSDPSCPFTAVRMFVVIFNGYAPSRETIRITGETACLIDCSVIDPTPIDPVPVPAPTAPPSPGGCSTEQYVAPRNVTLNVGQQYKFVLMRKIDGAWYDGTDDASSWSTSMPESILLSGSAIASAVVSPEAATSATRLLFQANSPGTVMVQAWACAQADPATLTVVAPPPPPAPEAFITANGSEGPITLTYGDPLTVNWSSTNADSCSISPTGWSGTSGNQNGAATASQTYTLTCTSAGGTATDAVTVNVGPKSPLITSINNATCPRRHTISWTDAGNETSYKVWTSTTNNAFNYGSGDGWTSIADLGADTLTYLRNTGITVNTNYWYIISASNSVGTVSSTSFGPTLGIPCIANLSPSTLTIYKVGSNTYSTNTPIKSGDKVTFGLNLINIGPGDADINYICVTPSSNFITLRNMSSGGHGNTSGNLSKNTARCPAVGGVSTYDVNVSGSKDIISPWFIVYDSTFQSSGAGLVELCSSTGRINYDDPEGSNKNQNLKFGPVLCNRGPTDAPDFHEIAP